ncbi:hypothetical protein [Roseibacillus ishigakijimensis]|uniref:Uncharacterized protein n=1 Tax=Roseibacillus ishigakijimensis TaxID=454146 RepID=A0A934RQ03_9BACT|nr:hypothetical protein [Roseibacillus ishigakijimensis]MBK1835364.1 hypothetical protein [Roseibacillus ishigakijimensis]
MKIAVSSALALLGTISLSAEQAWVSLSKVSGFRGYQGQVALFGVKESPADLRLQFQGEGADAFEVVDAEKGENNLLQLKVAFNPPAKEGSYAAELVVGQGPEAQSVQLRGVATPALEGHNEATLHQIVSALGMDVQTGSEELSLDTKSKKIGSSLAVSQFEPVAGQVVTLTPLARYSPPGETPFGFAVPDGKQLVLQKAGSLADTTAQRPDAHQTLRPPLASGQRSVTFANAPKRFGLFLKAHQYTSLTFPGKAEGATIEHTARIFPVTTFEGKSLENAYLVGFEEASNGDYQDAVFLIEGVQAVK